MNNLVTIEMTTIQEVDGEKDVNEVTYHGRCSIEDEVVILQYMTEDTEGSGHVRNRMELRNTGCILESVGDIKRRMEFTLGQRTTSTMILPMGAMEMDIDTHCYECKTIKEDPKHMEVKLTYDLYSGTSMVATNNLQIKIYAR